MSFAAYFEMADDDPLECRKRERDIFDSAIEKLRSIEHCNSVSDEVVSAVAYVQKLWIALIQDLKTPGNALSDSLKSNLISIGMWVVNATTTIVRGDFSKLEEIIRINTLIREGLE